MRGKTDVWQGTLALMVLKTLETMGPLHGYGIARRIEQTSGDLLSLNYGTLYPALLKLEQEGAIASEWGVSENNRKAKFYRLTRAGRRQLERRSANGNRRPRSSRGSWRRARTRHEAAARVDVAAGRAVPARSAGARACGGAREPPADAHRRQRARRHDARGGAAGRDPEAGRRGIDQEDYRERGTVPFVEHLAQDVRFAVRQLVKQSRLHRDGDRDARPGHWARASRSSPSWTPP